MKEIRKHTIIKDRQLILNLPEYLNSKEVEVIILPKNVSEDHTISAELSEQKNDMTEQDQENKSENLTKLFQSWREDEDEGEQKDTWEYLKQVLDEDRLSDRRLFL
jgi:hypothetical protein